AAVSHRCAISISNFRGVYRQVWFGP
ncbi:hypothetical protein pipiens_018622, partial [Culex pipiens pipiens]